MRVVLDSMMSPPSYRLDGTCRCAAEVAGWKELVAWRTRAQQFAAKHGLQLTEDMFVFVGQGQNLDFGWLLEVGCPIPEGLLELEDVEEKDSGETLSDEAIEALFGDDAEFNAQWWTDLADKMVTSYDEDPPECEDYFNERGLELAGLGQVAADKLLSARQFLSCELITALQGAHTALYSDADVGHGIHWCYRTIATELAK